ncbi:MAG: hypothetical protein ACYC28_12090 [Longimicrobiales bacterium]
MPVVADHTVSIYRRRDGAWELVRSGVQCDLQPVTGDVLQELYGRVIERQRRGFWDTGFDLREDDGVRVTAGPKPHGNWLVKAVNDWGAPGDLEADLVETGEDFHA